MITLQQLRCLREIARQSLSVSNAAAALDASQPGVSRQIQALERALGVLLLVRSKNRLLGFTEAGQAILELADRVVGAIDNMEAVAADARAEAQGLDPKRLLQENDGYRFFAAPDALVNTGPTLTNVNDFRAILVLPSWPGTAATNRAHSC